MNLLMITPRVGTSDPILAFIPNWIKHLAQRVETLWVVTPRAEGVELPKNVTVFEVGRDYEKAENFFHALRNFHNVLWWLTNKERVDGIFTHMYPKFAIMAAPYAKLKRIPLVMWFTHTHISLQLRFAHYLVDRVVTASSGSFRLPSDKVCVLGHGIDTDRFLPDDTTSGRKRDHRLILSIGRISPSKQYEVILKALEILVNRFTIKDVRTLIIGDVPYGHSRDYFDELNRQVDRFQLKSVVTFLGKVPHKEVIHYYQRAGIFVSASKSGLDKAVLEGMACAVVPVVSLEEFRPTLGKYAKSLMYPPGDVEALARRIKYILELPEPEWVSLGQEMRAKVQAFHNANALMGKLVRTFEEITKRNS